jgi:hypothetical protein
MTGPTVMVPTANLCVCPTRIRYRPPRIFLEKLVLDQGNKCHYGFQGCTTKIAVVAHLCHNPSCRNVAHLVGSCDYCNKSVSNQARRTEGRYVKDSVSVKGSEGGEEDSMEKNLRTEPAWVEWVLGKLRGLNPGVGLPKHDLTGDSAYQIGRSTRLLLVLS